MQIGHEFLTIHVYIINGSSRSGKTIANKIQNVEYKEIQECRIQFK